MITDIMIFFAKRKKIVLAFLIALFLCAFISDLRAESPFAQKIEKRLKPLKDENVGIIFYSVRDKKVLYYKNPKKLFRVASNNKLFVTACALVNLGPKFSFETKVLVKGKISSAGTLDGSLIVIGGGDPNISGRFYNDNPTAIFERWSKKLISKGIRKITGNIILDDHIFDHQFVHPTWSSSQLQYWYCAETSALSFNDNCVLFIVKPGKSIGSKARISMKPSNGYIKVVNKCDTTTRNTGLSFQRLKNTNTVTVKGRINRNSKGRTKDITVHNPTKYFGHVLKRTIERKGIKVSGKIIVSRKKIPTASGMKNLITHKTAFSKTVIVTNKRSQNFYAEQILKFLGHKFGRVGSFKEGVKVVGRFLKKIGLKRFSMVDGSGLSRKNKFSPLQVVKLLNYMLHHKYKKTFFQSLSVAGVDGTLRYRMRKSKCKGKVFAKTGTLHKTSALSGYIISPSKKVYIFSILVNDYKTSTWKVRRIQDELCEIFYLFSK